MTTIVTFYLSQILGHKIIDRKGEEMGKLLDLMVASSPMPGEESDRPTVMAIKTGTRNHPVYYNFEHFEIDKTKGKVEIKCTKKQFLDEDEVDKLFPLKAQILDKQIVDLNGRKLERVNDVRLVSLPSGTFAVAVDVGTEGLLRRLGVSKTFKKAASAMKLSLPSRFILWDEIDTLDTSNFNIKLGKPMTKLETLHPSDLADIIEDLGRRKSSEVFNSLDEERAADVLEEIEPKHQVDIIESMSVDKAAELLELMPADEAADLLDLLETEKSEQLLNEMNAEASQEVRELLGYSDRLVGSIMSTDYMSFHENETVVQALESIRETKPEEPSLYNLFVVTNNGRLMATVTLRDLLISEPNVKLKEIMHTNPVSVEDEDELDSLAEIVSKYNMLAVPVINSNEVLEGMVVIDDIVDDLMGKRRTI